MSISDLNMNNDLVERVFMNGEECDFVYASNDKVFQRLAPAGSEEFNYTGGNQEFTVPEGISLITVCIAGAGGGGGAFRGGGGGGGGAVTALRSVTAGQVINVFVGNGGLGSDRISTRGSSGVSSLATGDGFTSVFAFGGHGGITDDTSLGESGGGSGGDGLPPSAGGNTTGGCGGDYTGGSAGTSTGGGGAGGYGDGQDGAGSGVKTLSQASVSGGGGGVESGLPTASGWRGGQGGNGKCVISWDEQ